MAWVHEGARRAAKILARQGLPPDGPRVKLFRTHSRLGLVTSLMREVRREGGPNLGRVLNLLSKDEDLAAFVKRRVVREESSGSWTTEWDWDEAGALEHAASLQKEALTLEVQELSLVRSHLSAEAFQFAKEAIQLRLFRRRMHRQVGRRCSKIRRLVK